jgi:hypothetical protein
VNHRFLSARIVCPTMWCTRLANTYSSLFAVLQRKRRARGEPFDSGGVRTSEEPFSQRVAVLELECLGYFPESGAAPPIGIEETS